MERAERLDVTFRRSMYFREFLMPIRAGLRGGDCINQVPQIHMVDDHDTVSGCGPHRVC